MRLVQAQATPNALPATQDIFCNHLRQRVLILVQMDIMGLPVILALHAILIVRLALVQAMFNVMHVIQGTFCDQMLQQHVLLIVQVDIGKIQQTIFASLAIVLVRLVQAQATPNVLSAKQDILCNLRRQRASALVQMDIMGLPVTLALHAILIARLVLVQAIFNVMHVIQGSFCSQHLQQQHVLLVVPMRDIGRTRQITFAQLVMLLALFVQVQPTLNVILAKRGISCNLLRQRASALVQMGIMGLPVTLAHPAILIALFVRVQTIFNALHVILGTFCSQHLQQHVSPVVPLWDIGKTLSTTFARNAILLALFVQAQATLNVLLAKQDTSCNRLRQHASILVQTGIGRTLQTIFVNLATWPAQFAWMELILNAHLANQDIIWSRQQLVIAIAHLITAGTLLFLVVFPVMNGAQLVQVQAI